MASNSGVICLVVAWLLGSVLEVMASILPEWGVCYQRIEWHIMFSMAIFFPKVRIKLSFFTADFCELNDLETLKKFFFVHKTPATSYLSHAEKSMRKSIRDSNKWPDHDPKPLIMIRSQMSLIRNKNKRFPHDWGRTYENLFNQSFEIFQVAKICSKKIHIFILRFGKR